MPAHRNQRQRILDLLQAARGDWVPLPKILELRISQYSARVLELRRAGYRIENRTRWEGGQCQSWFRLVTTGTTAVATAPSITPSPPAAPKAAPAPSPPAADSWLLFPNRGEVHRDDG